MLSLVPNPKKSIAIVAFIAVLFSAIGCSKEVANNTSCDSVCSSVQCSANTQQGARCQNKTTNCCGRCYLHK